MLVVFVVLVVVEVLLYVLLYNTLLGTHDCTQTILGQEVQTQCGPSFILRLFVTALITGLITVVWSFAAAGLYKGALAVVDGKQFSMGQMFEGWDKGQVAIAAVLIGVATAIGSFLCYVPGLIVGFLMMFTLLFIVDKQMQAIDAIKASIKLVTDNLGQTIVWALLAIVRLHRRPRGVLRGSSGRHPDHPDRSGLHLPPAAGRAGRSPDRSAPSDSRCPTSYGVGPGLVSRQDPARRLSPLWVTRIARAPRLPAMSDLSGTPSDPYGSTGGRYAVHARPRRSPSGGGSSRSARARCWSR